MEAALFRRIQRYGWDAATDAYDKAWVPLLDRLTRHCVERAGLTAGERVLDLATGTGVGALRAAEAVGPTGAGTAVQLSQHLLDRAAAHGASRPAAATAVAAPLRFARADMEQTGAPDGAFDAVLAAFGLMYAADRTAAFAEIARVLSPGGRVSACVWGRRGACGWAEVFPIVDARVQSEVCPLFFSLGAPGALRFALDRAGLVDIVEERASLMLAWGSADEACRAMLEGGAVALAWKRFSPALRDEVRAAYLASIEPYRRGQLYEVPSEVVFATARKR